MIKKYAWVIWISYKCTLWSIFGPLLCLKFANTLFTWIWKMMQFTGLIRKVFATKILLFGKFSPFLTLYVGPRRDIFLTEIHFLQTQRINVPLFFTPDMLIFLHDILLLRLDLDTTYNRMLRQAWGPPNTIWAKTELVKATYKCTDRAKFIPSRLFCSVSDGTKSYSEVWSYDKSH